MNDISDIQKHLIDILFFLHEKCELNNIRYVALGGTMLGAARHKGFIPWDDDLDVGMPREDYEKFIRVMMEEKGRFILETPDSDKNDYLYPFAKLYDSSTTVVEKAKVECRRGVWIDIFPLDGIGNTWEEVQKNLRPLYMRNMFLAARTSVVRKERVWWKNVAIRVAGLIPDFLVNEKKIIRKLNQRCKKYAYENSKYVGILLGAYAERDVVERKIMDDIVEYPFENTIILGPKDYDAFLSHVYGNWRELPPEEKRTSGHDFSFIDLEHSFLQSK